MQMTKLNYYTTYMTWLGSIQRERGEFQSVCENIFGRKKSNWILSLAMPWWRLLLSENGESQAGKTEVWTLC